jgi:hypothetical protein
MTTGRQSIHNSDDAAPGTRFFSTGGCFLNPSEILKIPEGTVATRINRAKKAFQEIEPNVSINLDDKIRYP